ncbi:hypothetical protein OROGR_005666 [Orobanche gracilis]
MFDILFGWRKASKCKKVIKKLKCRLKLLKKKRCCIVKHLREDVAELLKHGHHQTAFQRVEQLIIDEHVVQLYDLVDQFCDFIIFHLPYIRRSRDCPNDINEAVSTLIFSSARFGELPELMSIRKLFRERYGQRFVTTALELRPGNLVNDQIKENLYIEKISQDFKYRMLSEIASSCMQQGPLFLEYKQELQQDQVDEEIINVDLSSGAKETSNEACFRLGNGHNAMESSYSSSSSESSSSSSCADDFLEEMMMMIYVDDIEEIVSPASKDGIQDQRLFLFKSFGTIPLNEKEKHKDEMLVRGFPWRTSLEEEKIDYGLECYRPDQDDGEGELTKQYGLRATTMPVERPKEFPTRNYNIIRSIAFPYEEQPYMRYSSCRHIHPKLPDYDELAAKFKALKIAKLSE